MRVLGIAAITVMIMFTVSCSLERNDEHVKRFFEKGPKIGDSPDAGLYKSSGAEGGWDYMATVHGTSDDMKFCQTIAECLHAQFPDEQYSCRILNK